MHGACTNNTTDNNIMCNETLPKQRSNYFVIVKLSFFLAFASVLRNITKLNDAVYHGHIRTQNDDIRLPKKENYVVENSFVPRKKYNGLRAIVTGLEHSGATNVGRILANAPCVIGAYETGYLLAPTPRDIESVMPWFEWNTASKNMSIENYRLVPDDIEAMKNATNFLDMYNILRHRSYLFNTLEPNCSKPSYMIDKTPRYIYPQYFEQVLNKTPGVPVVVARMNHDALNEAWRRNGGGDIPRELYNQVHDNVWAMKRKYPNRIFIVKEEDILKYPDAVMAEAFHHVGLEWDSEYLEMKGA